MAVSEALGIPWEALLYPALQSLPVIPTPQRRLQDALRPTVVSGQ